MPGEATQGCNWTVWAAAVLGVAILVSSFAAYDGRLFSPHIVARQAVLPCLVLGLLVVWLVSCRPGLLAVELDVIDVVVLAFGMWVAFSAFVSPAPWIAWLGYYNRGTGALFVLGQLLLLLCARRVLATRRAVDAVVWTLAGLLMLLAAWPLSRPLPLADEGEGAPAHLVPAQCGGGPGYYSLRHRTDRPAGMRGRGLGHPPRCEGPAAVTDRVRSRYILRPEDVAL